MRDSRNFQGFGHFIGVVEDRKDPLKCGRVRVRIIGSHDEDKDTCPTENLPWAQPLFSNIDAHTAVGYKEGDRVMGLFLDPDKQLPIVLGKFGTIPDTPANPELGFNDPSGEDEFTASPRPPEFTAFTAEDVEEALEDGEAEDEEEKKGRFSDPNKLPAQGIQWGVLQKDYDPKNFPWDSDGDGQYTSIDALANIAPLDISGQEGVLDGRDPFNGTFVFTEAKFTNSGYPLENQIKKPYTSPAGANEEAETGIVGKKKGDLQYFDSADHESLGFEDEASESENFGEPETAYAAVYPFNRTWYTESGHLIEWDDTPNAERLHFYHRSGTFQEYHPQGTLVTKSVDEQWTLAAKNYYLSSKESFIGTATKEVRLKAGAVMNLQSGADQNQKIGGKWNSGVGSSANFAIAEGWNVKSGDATTFDIGAEWTVTVGDKVSIFSSGGAIHIKCSGDVIVHGEQNVSLVAGSQINLESPIINMNGAVQWQSQQSIPFSNNATVSASIGGSVSPPALPAVPYVAPDNDAEKDEDEETEEEVTSTPQAGMVLDAAKSGDLWKPVSDGDGKPVSLSEVGGVHIMYEAIPIGETEDYVHEYLHTDLSITSWNVVRPKFKRGRVIEVGRFTGAEANGARHHYRWEKEAGEYPNFFFLETGKTKSEGSDGWLIVDPTLRHD